MRHTDNRDPEKRRAELLAIRCQLGERSAFDELVRSWHEPLWKYLRGLLGDTCVAEECLQDSWLAIIRALPGLRDPARLVPWMFSIARRGAMDRLRVRYRRPGEVDLDPDEHAAPEPTLSDEDRELLAVGLARLSPMEREVLSLFYLDALSLEEVADVLGVPTGTVKSRLHRARRALREKIQKEERQ